MTSGVTRGTSAVSTLLTEVFVRSHLIVPTAPRVHDRVRGRVQVQVQVQVRVREVVRQRHRVGVKWEKKGGNGRFLGK